MQRYIHRLQEERIRERLRHMPAVALLGPRQVGKSTLAKRIVGGSGKAIYLDLERPADLNKLRDPEAYFALHADKLICLDEIQRTPELFPVLRSVIDEGGAKRAVSHSRFRVSRIAPAEFRDPGGQNLPY